MDERLEKALAFSNYRTTIENRRKAIKRRFNTMMTVHFNNGMFKSDKETIGFVQALIESGHETATLLDERQNPIDITNMAEFKESLINTYFSAMNEYSTEMRKLATARNVKKAMDW